MVPAFKNVGERSKAVVFEKLVNNKIVDHLEKYGLFSDFQYGFRSSRSTADLLTIVSDRIASSFNRSGATRAVALDISKVLTGLGMLVVLTNLSLMEFQVRYLSLFFLFSIIEDFEWFWMGSVHKNIQLMLEFLKAPFLVLYFSYYILMKFLMMLDDVICDIAIYVILLSMWQQLKLASELESDLRDTVDWGKKWLVDFNAGKT